ncbi:DUF2254 domain-containing protein [Bremerella sp. JC817]|uniref:DUF2254 domain-containing protein n=1 Tax=Bremerella sp. JC817 TaxID=3231756 RepID=UPI00345AFAAC
MNLWNRAQHSLWFVPILCTFGGVVGAILMLWIDSTMKQSWDRPFWLETTIDGAQTVLSTIAGGMITVAGVVLSMEMVTLSITSSQFGSRVLRSRLGDRTTQWTIGMFLGTAVYSLLVLKMVRKLGEDQLFVPHLSVMAAIIFALTSLVVLLYFIHHVAMIAQAPEIVATLSSDLNRSIERIFPEMVGDGLVDSEKYQRDLTDAETQSLQDGIRITAKSEGYVQGIEADQLLSLAKKHDLIVELPKRPGDFLSRGETMARVVAKGDLDCDKLGSLINEAFIIGNNRTPWQDVNCAVHELAQMAVRALSPGINDPYTAVNCIDRLSSALAQLAQRRMPSANRFDEEGNLRLVVDRQTFTGVMHAAFDQIRCYAIGSVAVSQRLMEGYHRIADVVEERSQADDVLYQARLTIEGMQEQAHHPADLKVIRDQYQRLTEQLQHWLDSQPKQEKTSNEESIEEESEEEGEASGEVIG